MSEEAQITLRDTLNEAFDAADEPAVEKPAEKPAENVEDKAAEGDRARDEKGRFTKTQADAAESPPAEAPKPRPSRPTSWKKDYEADWEKLDPRIAEYIAQREGEFAKGVSQYKQEWDRAKPVLEALTPFQQHFQQYGIRPEQWIASLGAAHQALALGSPQQKLQMFAKLAQDYGVPLQALMPQQGGPQPPVDPRLMALAQQTQHLRNELQTFRSQQEQAQQERVRAEIAAFGNESHPHFEAVRETMAELMERGLASDLQTAYDLALRMPQHDDIAQRLREEKRRAEEAERAAQAAKAKQKAVSPRTSSPGKTVGSDKGLREMLAEQLDSAGTGRV